MVIEPAAARDLPDVRALLQRHHLPLDGVNDLAPTTIVARDENRLVAAPRVPHPPW